jgi:hypothetical protein
MYFNNGTYESDVYLEEHAIPGSDITLGKVWWHDMLKGAHNFYLEPNTECKERSFPRRILQPAQISLPSVSGLR